MDYTQHKAKTIKLIEESLGETYVILKLAKISCKLTMKIKRKHNKMNLIKK